MPVTNYCSKCKAEVPLGDSCPRCGGRLTKTGERLSFTVTRLPVTDWFAWNGMLRVEVSVIGVVLLTTVLSEAVTEGAAGVQAVFVQGFIWTLMGALGLLLVFTLTLLLLQGPEEVRYMLDARGVHARTVLRNPSPIRIYARLLTPQAIRALRVGKSDASENGLTDVRRTDLPWSAIRRVRFWPETRTILFFQPTFWQALYIRCGENEYNEAEAYVRKKLTRHRKALKPEK